MAKIKFECDVNKYINDYNEYILYHYNEEKSAYEKARKSLIALLCSLVACVVSFLLTMSFIFIPSHSYIYLIIGVVSALFMLLTFALFCLYCNKTEDCFFGYFYFYDIKSLKKKFEDVMSIEQFSETYCSFVASKERIIYSILNNEDYKLLDMSVIYLQSHEEYLLKINYSYRNEVTVKKAILRERIKTDIDDFIVSIDKSEFGLLIPYKKQNELSPDVEYYVDIAEFLDSINASKIDKIPEQRTFISYMTGEEYIEEEFLKLTSEEVRKKALERKKQNL